MERGRAYRRNELCWMTDIYKPMLFFLMCHYSIHVVHSSTECKKFFSLKQTTLMPTSWWVFRDGGCILTMLSRKSLKARRYVRFWIISSSSALVSSQNWLVVLYLNMTVSVPCFTWMWRPWIPFLDRALDFWNDSNVFSVKICCKITISTLRVNEMVRTWWSSWLWFSTEYYGSSIPLIRRASYCAYEVLCWRHRFLLRNEGNRCALKWLKLEMVTSDLGSLYCAQFALERGHKCSKTSGPHRASVSFGVCC